MKNLIKQLAFALVGTVCCLSLFSCVATKPQLASVQAPVKQNEFIVSNDLRAFLAKSGKKSVVLRTPNRPDNITVAQKEQENIVYNELEKALIGAGFDVKDRASVGNVLGNISRTAQNRDGDIFDYAQIGKLLNVDIFIEITDLSFNVPFEHRTYKLKSTGVEYRLNNAANVLNTTYAQFSFRLVIAETGSVGGMFTMYQQRCTEGCDFYVLNNPKRVTGASSFGLFSMQAPAAQPQTSILFQMPEQLGSNTAYAKLNWEYWGDEKEIASYFAAQLIKILNNQE